VQLARDAGARVIQRKFDDFAEQRNFGVVEGKLIHPWVFHLDADEVVTIALARELQVTAETAQYDGYRVSSKLVFLGRWIRHASLFPWYQVRFGRTDRLRFELVGHGQRETLPSEALGTLGASLLHYPFTKGISDWIDKHNRYASAEAKRIAINAEHGSLAVSRSMFARDSSVRRRALKRFFAVLPMRPTLRFLYMYILRLGVLDGRAGLAYCRLLTWYERLIVWKEREMRSAVGRQVANTAGDHLSTQVRRTGGVVPLSVLIPVKNDAPNLRACLGSVAFANDIVVVDSNSTDETGAIAAEAGARLMQFPWTGGFPRKKNWALENVQWQNEWVLIIDADERITPELQAEIVRAIVRRDVDGFCLNRRYWFFGGWIHHSGYFPNWNLRLFRHRKGRYERFSAGGSAGSGDNEVHEHVLLDGRTEYLQPPMDHYAFPDLTTFVEKHNRYSSWEAAVRQYYEEPTVETVAGNFFGSPIERRRWLKRVTLDMPFRPFLRFIYHYIVRQGFRDCYRGWLLCRLMAWYERLILLKARESRLRAKQDKRADIAA
jgi:glycosyltransferase involved in cell wall biosynthesis